MSVDTLRETFHISVVSQDLLDDFLTAQTYRKDITQAYETVKGLQWDYLQNLSKNKISQGPTPVYSETGIACLKSKHTVDIITSIPKAGQDLVDADWSDKKHSFIIQKNDLVITRKGAGTIGRVSVYLEDQERNSDDSLFKVSILKTKADPCFIASFLRTNIGERLLEKGVYGSTGQLSLSSAHIRKLPVFTPGFNVQTYIGDKVRQAAMLREWAQATQNEVMDIFPKYFSGIKSGKKNSYITSVSTLSTQRLDSEFYNPDYMSLESILVESGSEVISSVAKQVKDSWNKKSSAFHYYEIGGLNVSNGQVESVVVPTIEAPSRAKTSILQGDVLVSTVRPNRKNVGFVIDLKFDMEMVATSGFSVLRFDTLENAAFYHSWLRSDDATAQLMRWNSGSTYPAIDDDVPLNILAPVFDQNFKSYWGKRLLQTQFAFLLSNALVSASKQIVEFLIEGYITAAEIIAAQQALENDDNTKDRAILSKLTDKGYAVKDGKPLFTDLDALYELLGEAQLFQEDALKEKEQG